MKTKNIILWVIFILIIGLAGYYFYPEPNLPPDTQVDSMVVYKSKRQLLAYSNGKLLKTYKISLGKNPIGDKKVQGDKKTPEGIYTINGKNPHSGYYKNLGISYPDSQDIEDAKSIGKSTGGDVKIHGIRNRFGFISKFHRWFDWTAGCIALTDNEVDELFKAVEVGTKIEIKP